VAGTVGGNASASLAATRMTILAHRAKRLPGTRSPHCSNLVRVRTVLTRPVDNEGAIDVHSIHRSTYVLCLI